MDYANSSAIPANCVLCLGETEQVLSTSRVYLTKISDIYLEYLKPNFTTTTSSVSFDWDILENTGEFFSSKFCMECFTSGQKLLSMNNRLKSIELEIENFVQTISIKILNHRSKRSESLTSVPSISTDSVSNQRVSNQWTYAEKSKADNVDIKQEICADDLFLCSPSRKSKTSCHSNTNNHNSLNDVDFFNEWSSELDNDTLSTGCVSDVEENGVSDEVESPKPIVILERLKPEFTNHQRELRQPRPGPSSQTVENRRKTSYSEIFEDDKEVISDVDEPDDTYDSDYAPNTRNKNISSQKPSNAIKKEEGENKGEYECMHCDETFVCRRKYRSHIQTAHKDVADNCTKCDRTFINKETIRLHIDYFHCIRPILCNDCPELPKFLNLYEYEIHRMSHTGEIPYECQQCHEKFSNYSTYCDHRKWCATSNEVFNCEKCDNVFTAKCFLLCHINATHQKTRQKNGGKLSCYICDTHPKFKDLLLLETHYAAEHTNEFVYLCDICGDSFQSRHVFKRHRRSHLGGADTSTCHFCGYAARNYYSLQEHIKLSHMQEEASHSCEKCGKVFPNSVKFRKHASVCGNTHTCEICGKSFNSKKSFKDHCQVHQEGKPTCNICGKDFETSSGLRTHMVIKHLKRYKFMCDACGREFDRKDSYVQHMRNHTEGRSRECKICGEILGSLFKLKEHRRTVHLAQEVVCKYCPMTFPTHGKRRKHEDKQHSEMISVDKYKCSTCGMGFHSDTLRNRHRKSVHRVGK